MPFSTPSLLTTLRSRLVLCFFLFILIAAGVVFTGFWFYQEREQLTEVEFRLSGILVNVLQASQEEHTFLASDADQAQFFQQGSTLTLSNHHQLITRVAEDIKNLRGTGTRRYFRLDQHLDSLEEALQRYTYYFGELTQLVRRRGFKDYGLEGRMRAYAQALENGVLPAQRVDVLSLRRLEKDYIIRKDTAYAVQFAADITAFRSRLAARSNLQREELLSTLAGYQQTFADLVALEARIGVSPSLGLRAQVNRQALAIEELIYTISQEANRQADAALTGLHRTLLVTGLTSTLLCILLGFWIADQITRPLTRLSRRMNQIAAQNFQQSVAPLPVRSQDEIGRLTANFNTMLSHLGLYLEATRQQAEELRSQSESLQDNSREMQQRNQELEAYTQRLEESEASLRRLNTVKDKFFSILSHDLKGPLHTLTGFLQILVKYTETFTQEEIKEFAGNMDQSVKRLLRLLENLLQWSLSQTGNLDFKPVSVPLNAAVHDNLELLRETAQLKAITLRPVFTEACTVRADRNMLDFILRNLVSNAIKFTDAGGSVTVSVVCGAGDMAEITVTDTGIGIADEDINKIFQPDTHYSTTGTAKEKGTGFGLLLCKDFVERHGGRIRIQSAVGEGTSLTFTLPIALEQTAAA